LKEGGAETRRTAAVGSVEKMVPRPFADLHIADRRNVGLQITDIEILYVGITK
jgi:hypothetical protein